MTEVEYLESRMREERKEQNEKVAAELRAIYESLVDQGFTGEQAWDLFVLMVKKAWENS